MSKDLFDDSTMTFGEHLEVLRVHLVKALIGLVLAVILSLFFSQHVIRAIQVPVQNAMERHFGVKANDSENIDEASKGLWQRIKEWYSGKAEVPAQPPSNSATNVGATGAAGSATGSAASTVAPATVTPDVAPGGVADPATTAAAKTLSKPLVLKVDLTELAAGLHEAHPKIFPKPPAAAAPRHFALTLPGTAVDQLKKEILNETLVIVEKENAKARTDTPDEAFMIYLKVSVVTGFVVASPWVFYQLWLFVAAGLYQHEQKYVHTYLPFSIFLFLGGALFCFFVVIPYVLDFLFQFNTWLGLRPEMKINSWISFAMILSLMFGISFQLPLVMLFMERISIFTATDYREKRRISILAISIISMVLTPSDPISMTLMMVPLCLLYELGILLCGKGEKQSPFDDGAPSTNRSLEPQSAKFPAKS